MRGFDSGGSGRPAAVMMSQLSDRRWLPLPGWLAGSLCSSAPSGGSASLLAFRLWGGVDRNRSE